jgi:hypothetical protein
MADSAESNLLTLVKPRSTWVITSKTEPTTPNDPLDQVKTPLWSNFGQRHGQTPLKPLMSMNVLRTFCRVLQISPKYFKISQYESCPVLRGTFQILSGKGWKTWSTASSSCSLEQGDIQSLAADCAKSEEKNALEPL